MDASAPNIDMLRQLYKQNLVAKAFFDHAARRERDQSETKVDRKVVSEQLGHTSAAFTLDVYSHVLPHMQDDAAAKVEAALFGQSQPPGTSGLNH